MTQRMVGGNLIDLTVQEEAAYADRLAAYPAKKARRDIVEEISRLESLETPRRLSEAMGGEAGGVLSGRQWLKANRALIAIERAKLT